MDTFPPGKWRMRPSESLSLHWRSHGLHALSREIRHIGSWSSPTVDLTGCATECLPPPGFSSSSRRGDDGSPWSRSPSPGSNCVATSAFSSSARPYFATAGGVPKRSPSSVTGSPHTSTSVCTRNPKSPGLTMIQMGELQVPHNLTVSFVPPIFTEPDLSGRCIARADAPQVSSCAAE